jgi:uncharacterized coiled-coil DUF342 family protein
MIFAMFAIHKDTQNRAEIARKKYEMEKDIKTQFDTIKSSLSNIQLILNDPFKLRQVVEEKGNEFNEYKSKITKSIEKIERTDENHPHKVLCNTIKEFLNTKYTIDNISESIQNLDNIIQQCHTEEI